MTKKREECYLCYRITPTMVLDLAHKIIPNEEQAHKIGMEACRIIKEEYLRFPPNLCGWKPSLLIGSLLYLLSLKEGLPITQRRVCQACGVIEMSLRNGVKKWYKIIPHLREEVARACRKMKFKGEEIFTVLTRKRAEELLRSIAEIGGFQRALFGEKKSIYTRGWGKDEERLVIEEAKYTSREGNLRKRYTIVWLRRGKKER